MGKTTDTLGTRYPDVEGEGGSEKRITKRHGTFLQRQVDCPLNMLINTTISWVLRAFTGTNGERNRPSSMRDGGRTIRRGPIKLIRNRYRSSNRSTDLRQIPHPFFCPRNLRMNTTYNGDDTGDDSCVYQRSRDVCHTTAHDWPPVSVRGPCDSLLRGNSPSRTRPA